MCIAGTHVEGYEKVFCQPVSVRAPGVGASVRYPHIDKEPPFFLTSGKFLSLLEWNQNLYYIRLVSV